MDTKRLTGGIKQAVRIRLWRKRHGTNLNGSPLWTPEEDEVVRRLAPDYQAIKMALRRRSFVAGRQRAHELGFAKWRIRSWKASEVTLLRKLYGRASQTNLLAAFPGSSRQRIADKAQSLGLKRPRPRLVASGSRLIDAIRHRALDLNMTMGDIDGLAGTGRYFGQSYWHGRKFADGRAIVRAVAALGGRLVIEWED